MSARIWSPRTGKVTTTVSVDRRPDRRVVLVAALLALITSAAGFSVSTENAASPSTKITPRQLSSCNCEWTTEYACPDKTAGTKGFAQDDGTACFQACCPGASAAERIRALLTQMVLDTEISALLPTLPEEERNARKHANQLINGQPETASVLLDAFTQAHNVTDLTSGLILYFTKIDPKFLRWSSSEQEWWLTKTLVLKRRAHVTSLKEYLDGLVSSIQDLLEQGVDDGLFPAYDNRDKSEALDDLRSNKTADKAADRLLDKAADRLLDKAKEHILDKAIDHVSDKAKDRIKKALIKKAGQILIQVAASELLGDPSDLLEFPKPMLGFGGAGLAAMGALIGGGMAAGPVALAIEPVVGAVMVTEEILPDDDAGHAGTAGAAVAAPVALGGIYAATTAGGASASLISTTLAWWGGGALAAGGSGVAGGVAVLGGMAVLSVAAVGAGVYGTYKIADHMIVTDEEAEAFQCDCEWTLTYTCPSSLKPTSPHWAKNDGSMCFDYCCKFVEEVKQIASEFIDQRDLLASEVYKAREQYLIANSLGGVLSANPTVSPILLVFAVLGGAGIVALGARRLRSVSML